MSRIGNRHITLPEKVKVKLEAGLFVAEGPLGKEEVKIHPKTKVNINEKDIGVEQQLQDADGSRLQGLIRSLVANAVKGVSQGFKRDLDINGVGYRAEVKGKTLNLVLGFSHQVDYEIPDGIKIAVEKQTHLVVSGSNKERVGRVASEIRAFRPPEPYKGKGIKYTEEHIIRKVGKAAASAGGTGGA